MSDSYSSSSYSYSSISNTTDGTTTTGHRYTTTSLTNPDGTTIVRTARQDLGQPAIIEERRYDRTGQEQLLPAPTGTTSAGGIKRITDLDEEKTTGSTALDAGSAYGSAAGVSWDGGEDEVGRRTYDTGSPFGARTYNPRLGVYDQSRDYDSDGVPRRYRGRVDRNGYTKTKGEEREYEDPNTGARLRRLSDVDMSEVTL
ncbi:hypothetical protein ASPWEDRAFT_546044 [Aspergillus wentii DTO 134E9]|uniref:Uncharacterized protein n=1 Tax=Aspergillus wentii DTO 134E9 TaxID=1073089 RepID=A0A1L9RFV0_ASPWE|nr:uncharacterized protein ASPWEDRAFT_546044 [Aspergillus wentii DTO 134E9]OJJ33809.1 hypothetical protein ASPWEDRAFT_546044 [Aspergillus wentii DTO 134E9]